MKHFHYLCVPAQNTQDVFFLFCLVLLVFWNEICSSLLKSYALPPFNLILMLESSLNMGLLNSYIFPLCLYFVTERIMGQVVPGGRLCSKISFSYKRFIFFLLLELFFFFLKRSSRLHQQKQHFQSRPFLPPKKVVKITQAY